MPDTGAPWNIPYVEPSDLVRTYPAADELQALAIAAGLSAAGNPGIGSNVVIATDATNRTISSGSFVDASISVTITPTSATSKVLLYWSVTYSADRVGGSPIARFRLTDASDTALVGAEDVTIQDRFADNVACDGAVVVMALASPSTTSAVTFKGRCARTGSILTLQNARNTAQLIAIEVAA